jgi:hypothetical protein
MVKFLFAIGILSSFDIFNSFLVGEGAKQWAQQNGLPLIDSQQMKTGLFFDIN